MKTKTIYVADDGVEFTDFTSCANYKELCEIVDFYMRQLPKAPNTSSFQAGKGYIQHDIATVKLVRNKIIKFLHQACGGTFNLESATNGVLHPSYISYHSDHIKEKCLKNAWYRFQCMTEEFKEYGQPYFCNNPDQAKNFCINK
jgi:hypothetical protein